MGILVNKIHKSYKMLINKLIPIIVVGEGIT